MKRKIILKILALALTFGFALSGCRAMGDSIQNNIGEIIDDDFAIVQALGGYSTSGMKMVTFAGNDLTPWNKYKITRAIMGLGNDTIDLKVTPGNHQ